MTADVSRGPTYVVVDASVSLKWALDTDSK